MGGRGSLSTTGTIIMRSLSLPKSKRTIYLKPREALTDDERAGIDQLENIGIFPVVNEQDDGAKSNIDLTIDGVLYELKNVTSVSSISTQFNRARRKFYRLKVSYPPRFVFTSQHSSLTFKETVEEIYGRLHDGEIAIVLHPSGKYEMLEK